MDELKTKLRENEKLLWTGKPNNVVALDAQYKKSIMTKLIIAIIVVIALCVGYIAVSKGQELKVGIFVIIIAIGAIVAMGSFQDAKKLNTIVEYAITDQRILVSNGKWQGIDYSDVSKAKFVKDAAGQTSLLINNAVDDFKYDGIRTIAITCPNKSDSDFKKEIALYALPNPSAVESLLREYLSI